jgi:hypothetical protein
MVGYSAGYSAQLGMTLSQSSTEARRSAPLARLHQALAEVLVERHAVSPLLKRNHFSGGVPDVSDNTPARVRK